MQPTLSNEQSTATPKLTKAQMALLQMMALPHITHLMEGFRGAFIGGIRGWEKGATNATARKLMHTAYLTRHRGTNAHYYTISQLGIEVLAAHQSES
jgi:hypothetical protein